MNVTIFGGAKNDRTSKEYLETVEIGKMLAKHGYVVKSGGYGGMMEAVSKGAVENDGKAIGYTCAKFPSIKGNKYLSETYVSVDIYDRLRYLIEESNLFIVQRGGLGTLSELFLTLDIIRKKEIKPQVLLIGDFWNEIIANISILLNDNEIHLVTIINDYKEIEKYLNGAQ